MHHAWRPLIIFPWHHRSTVHIQKLKVANFISCDLWSEKHTVVNHKTIAVLLQKQGLGHLGMVLLLLMFLSLLALGGTRLMALMPGHGWWYIWVYVVHIHPQTIAEKDDQNITISGKYAWQKQLRKVGAIQTKKAVPSAYCCRRSEPMMNWWMKLSYDGCLLAPFPAIDSGSAAKH